MNNHIIDARTGTVIKMDQCYIVDIDNLSEEDYDVLSVGSDTEVAELAIRVGTRMEGQ